MPLLKVPPVLKARHPFNKWQELDPGAFPPPREPTEEELDAERQLLRRAWILRWGWLLVTLVVAFGYAFAALSFSGDSRLGR